MTGKATEREAEALRWLLEHERTWEIRGGDFCEYYAERAERESGRPVSANSGRFHAWRRTGGAVLGRMAVKGLVRASGTDWGTRLYTMTDAGMAVARGES